MTTLTKKQFQKLTRIQHSVYKYMQNLKTWNSESIVIDRKKEQWQQLTEKFGILSDDGETVRYVTECGEDYSDGYNFGDLLA
jgi:hypothetical protein